MFKSDESNEMLNNLKDIISKISRFVQINSKIREVQEKTIYT